MSLGSLAKEQQQQPPVAGIVIKEPGHDDKESAQSGPEPSVTRAKLKSVIIDTRHLKKEDYHSSV